MLKDKRQEEYENVYGETYTKAQDAMQQLEYAIETRINKGFSSKEECAKFAHDIHVDLAVYMRSRSGYYYVNHKGDVLVQTAWQNLYASVLYWVKEDDEGKKKRQYYFPGNYSVLNQAKLYGEQGDGKYAPLFSRNYFVPTGYYDEATATYNVAKPITTFARMSGADTKHIHTLLQHIAGECYPYILSWLRAKMVNPIRKTEVVPIFIGQQGTGKSTFGEVICSALFGQDNVLVTHQFDASARFNADSADALVIAIEEKSEQDRKNSSSDLKSRATATKVRKENKGVDPIYQASHTDYVLTTNELVPLKFEDRGNQRRFMVMEVDPNFTREKSALADEVFTRLYGEDGYGNKVGVGLVDDKATIEQFKHELWEKKGFEDVNYKQFPKTEAYTRCFSIPRTNEAVEIEAIAKALVPFILNGLLNREVQQRVEVIEDDPDKKVTLYMDQLVHDVNAVQFFRKFDDLPDRIAINRQLVFCEPQFNKPYAHSVVERTLMDMRNYFNSMGLVLIGDSAPPPNGFKNIVGKAKHSPTAWFALKVFDDDNSIKNDADVPAGTDAIGKHGTRAFAPNLICKNETGRLGQRVRYNARFVPDPTGEFETLNELKPGCLDRKAENAQYLDTFLLEADETSLSIQLIELRTLSMGMAKEEPWDAEKLYKHRLAVQDVEAERLMQQNIICRAVYSGSKSIHLLVRVEDSPLNIDEREWLDAYLKATLSTKLTFDATTRDPTRLTRAPDTVERLTPVLDYDVLNTEFKYNKDQMVRGTQRLLFENWNNIYRINWRPVYDAWKHSPPEYFEERGRMLPTRQQYKDAAIALLDGTFFTSNAWTGRRQECFFPAYRLLRHMGYTHDELWTEFAVQISGYRKKNEIPYWQTRKTCKLIKSIDEEIDNDRQ